MLDVDGKAEIIAMARKMLKRKEKENIIDAAYSRFVFHDTNMPKWFEHDNDIYNRYFPDCPDDSEAHAV